MKCYTNVNLIDGRNFSGERKNIVVDDGFITDFDGYNSARLAKEADSENKRFSAVEYYDKAIAFFDEKEIVPKKLLNKMLQIGQEEGFETRNFDNYVGSITYPGKTKENIGIWAHLDVVDEGKDWDFSPYEPTVKNGYMVARGCNDNKSSAAIALFALKYMKCGVKLLNLRILILNLFMKKFLF